MAPPAYGTTRKPRDSIAATSAAPAAGTRSHSYRTTDVGRRASEDGPTAAAAVSAASNPEHDGVKFSGAAPGAAVANLDCMTDTGLLGMLQVAVSFTPSTVAA